MPQNFFNFLLALMLAGVIFFQSQFPKTQDFNVSKPISAPTPLKLGASLPTAVKLPGLPYLAIEDSAQFFPIRNWNTPSIELKARAAVAVDFSSERFFHQKNIDEPLPIASLTKLMTALIILENYNLDDLIEINKEAIMTEGDKGDLISGEKLSVKILLKIMLIESSNDAAVALAERLGVPRFIELMNQKTQELGMSASRFSDPAGLDDNGNLSSARDLVKLTKNLFSVWPGIAEITKTQSAEVFSADGKIIHRLKNSNKLLEHRPEILGGKTGYTEKAGECLVLLSQINENNKVITVVLSSPDRFGESEKLINWLKEAYIWR